MGGAAVTRHRKHPAVLVRGVDLHQTHGHDVGFIRATADCLDANVGFNIHNVEVDAVRRRVGGIARTLGQLDSLVVVIIDYFDDGRLHLSLGRDDAHLSVTLVLSGSRHHQHKTSVLAESGADLAFSVVANLKLGNARVEAALLAKVENEQFAANHDQDPIVNEFQLFDLSLKDDLPDEVFNLLVPHEQRIGGVIRVLARTNAEEQLRLSIRHAHQQAAWDAFVFEEKFAGGSLVESESVRGCDREGLVVVGDVKLVSLCCLHYLILITQ